MKGEEAGRFRKVAGVSIVDAGGVFTVDTLTVDTSGLISIFQDESLLLCVCVMIATFVFCSVSVLLSVKCPYITPAIAGLLYCIL